jgi:chromosome segregation ATPase
MSNINQKIQNLEDEIDSIDEQIKNHSIVWAQEYFSSLKKNEKPVEIIELNTLFETIDKKIGRLRELEQEELDLQNKIKEIKQSESEEYKGWSNFYQSLGKRSFELYKKGQMNDSDELDDLFNPLMEYENQIRNADNELFRIRNKDEDKKILNRVGNFIKKSTQSSKKKSAGDALQKQYKKTGEALIKDGYFNEVAQNGLSDIYDEFQNKEALSKKFKDELVELSNRIDVIELEIDELSEKKGSSRGIKNLESKLEETENKLESAFLRLGQELYGSESNKNESYRKLIDELNQERNDKVNNKSALLIEIRLGELEESLQKKEKDLKQQKEKIGREQEKFDSLEQEKDTLTTKIKQLKIEHKSVLKKIEVNDHD